MQRNGTRAGSLTDLLSDPQTSSTINLIFTYLFTALTLTFLHRNFHRFVQSRQSFALHLIHSVSSRTVLVTEVPKHLRGDKALADYFENCGWSVESVSVVREMDTLKRVLESRTNALLQLEGAWTNWVGNPAKGAEGYDPNVYGDGKKAKKHRQTHRPQVEPEPLIPGLENGSINNDSQGPRVDTDVENQDEHHCHSHVHTSRPRPSFRPKPLGNKVDAIDHWEKQFAYADEETRSMRQKGRFEATGAAFVTFEDVKSAVSDSASSSSLMAAEGVANGLSGRTLPASLAARHAARARTEGRGLVQSPHVIEREDNPELCRCWSFCSFSAFLDR